MRLKKSKRGLRKAGGGGGGDRGEEAGAGGVCSGVFDKGGPSGSYDDGPTVDEGRGPCSLFFGAMTTWFDLRMKRLTDDSTSRS
jgi:hypothetical protein